MSDTLPINDIRDLEDPEQEMVLEAARSDLADFMAAELPTQYGAHKLDSGTEITKRVVLQALEIALKELLAQTPATANPQEENAFEVGIRRERAVSDAVTAAYDILDDRSDGTVEEKEYLVTELLVLVSRKILNSAQHRVLSMDIRKRTDINQRKLTEAAQKG